MTTQIYVNLPVKNLKSSMEFFTKLGFGFDPQHTGGDAACLVIGENIFVMLIQEAKFRTFTPNAVCDTNRFTEALVCITAESRDRVDEIVRSAVRGGGMIFKAPEDHGFMYGHGFQDLDGHIWEVITTEPAPKPGT
jgi:predicted lactoylglutathione lyase